MLGVLKRWIERRRAKRRLVDADARDLIRRDERNAYYDAQRLAARSRFRGETESFWHWAAVAAEVARVSPVAEMDMRTVEAIVDEEERESGRIP